MGRVDDLARRFSLAGVLDEERQSKERYPVEELEVSEIEDHPANGAYSMDPNGIRSLAESIRKDGLTDIPLVRRLPDGGFQMLSGHRRKAAYALLAEDDPSFSRMPCRIVEGITDDQALTLLHTANYFTRELNVIERAKATQALGIQVERMRASDPDLKGVATDELKAAIIRNQTGRSISGRTVRRQEAVARKAEQDLVGGWRERALASEIGDRDIENLASLPHERQGRLLTETSGMGRPETSAAIRAAAREERPDTSKALGKAATFLRSALKSAKAGGEVDEDKLKAVERLAASLRARIQ
jgi:ParB family chromosome partitioning protein